MICLCLTIGYEEIVPGEKLKENIQQNSQDIKEYHSKTGSYIISLRDE